MVCIYTIPWVSIHLCQFVAPPRKCGRKVQIAPQKKVNSQFFYDFIINFTIEQIFFVLSWYLLCAFFMAVVFWSFSSRGKSRAVKNGNFEILLTSNILWISYIFQGLWMDISDYFAVIKTKWLWPSKKVIISVQDVFVSYNAWWSHRELPTKKWRVINIPLMCISNDWI